MIKPKAASSPFLRILTILIVMFSIQWGPRVFLFLQLAMVVTVCCFLVVLFRSSHQPVVYPGQSGFLLAFFIIVAIQLVPLPVGVLKIISPHTLVLYQRYLPQFNLNGLYPLSVYSFVTRQELVRAIVFICIPFIIVLNTCRTRRQVEHTIILVIMVSVGLAFFGIVKKYFILEEVITKAFSTFANRNHYAGYMVMVAPFTLGYALSCHDRAKKLLFSFFCALLSATVFLSLSRAGSISLIFAMGIMAFLLRKEKGTGKRWVAAILIVLVLAMLFVAGADGIRYRFAQVREGLSVRFDIVKESMPIVRDFPFFGVGLGCFRYAFTSYQRSLGGLYHEYLHNDHLQLIVEVGVVGALFYLLFVFLSLKRLVRQVFVRRDPFVKNLLAGGIGGLSGVLVHSFFEFNFHSLANMSLFWFVFALMYKVAFTRFAYEREDSKEEN